MVSPSQEFVRSQGRSVSTHLTFLTEGSETASFRSYFDNWPQTVEPKLYEDGRGKVAGCALMQQTLKKKKIEYLSRLFLVVVAVFF